MTIHRFFRVVLLLLSLALASCAMDFPLSEAEPFQPKEGHCVILVGVRGTETILLFNEEHFEAAHNLAPSSAMGVFAFQYPIGRTLRMKRVAAEPGALSGRSIKFREANIANAHSLTPTAAGIYYYGTILSEGERVGVTERQLPEILALAKQKYGNIFRQLTPLNFK